jgi:2-(1,2-epoxy-1,2-dihydrophenyl)acetyl-CoA isomerase
MMSNNISLEIKDGVAVFMLSRPEAYNSFDLDMIRELARDLTSIALEKSVTGVVISGNGKAFCA